MSQRRFTADRHSSVKPPALSAAVCVLMALSCFFSTQHIQVVSSQDFPVEFSPVVCSEKEYVNEVMGTPSTLIATPEAGSMIWEVTAGAPDVNNIVYDILPVVEMFFSCANAASFVGVAAVVTEEFRTQHHTLPWSSVADVSIDEALWVAYTEIIAVRVHDPDTAVMFISAEDMGYCSESITLALILRLNDRVWLIDDVAQITEEGSPVPYLPSGIRPIDYHRCLEWTPATENQSAVSSQFKSLRQ